MDLCVRFFLFFVGAPLQSLMCDHRHSHTLHIYVSSTYNSKVSVESINSPELKTGDSSKLKSCGPINEAKIDEASNGRSCEHCGCHIPRLQ